MIRRLHASTTRLIANLPGSPRLWLMLVAAWAFFVAAGFSVFYAEAKPPKS